MTRQEYVDLTLTEFLTLRERKETLSQCSNPSFQAGPSAKLSGCCREGVIDSGMVLP